MSKQAWTFERVPRMGGATGEAFVNTLQGTGMTPASVLAREAIQNSSDAWRPELAGKVKVVFRRVSLTGQKKKSFVKALELDHNFGARKRVLGLQQDHCINTIGDLDRPLHLLYVEDYGTHGLYGDPDDPESHFFRLLLSLGDGTKSREKGSSGGSYGYGKSVYSANSRIHTIVAYSSFDPAKGSGRHRTRLMGCAYLHAHKFESTNYSGRAWFGISSKNDALGVDPLHDGLADDVAESLGFEKRGDKSRGTSILIVDCSVDCDEIRSSVEEWWWPRLLDESLGLDVMLYEEGRLLQPPRPRSRQDLKPFIHCFEMAIGRSEPVEKQDKSALLNKWNGSESPGSYGFRILEEKDLNDEPLQGKNGRVALIRGPRMVVSYMEVGGTLPLPCAGAFVASESVERPLKMSEPPSHDKWDPHSSRLLELPDDERLAVKTIIDRLKQGLRRFSNEAAPPAPKQDMRLRSLERLLGAMFKPPTKGGGGGGGHPAAPIEIKFTEQPHIVAEGKGVRTKGSFRVALAEGSDRNDVQLSVDVECLAVEDQGVSKEDPISATIEVEGVSAKHDKDNGNRLIFSLDRTTKAIFSFATDSYPSDWTTRIAVNVREVA